MLELKSVSLAFKQGLLNRTVNPVLRDVDFTVEKGDFIGLIGDSGSGKTTLARTAVRSINPDCGRIILDGEDITVMGSKDMSRYRFRLQMVFQHPEGALNPEMTLGDSIKEALLKSGASAERIREELEDVCSKVGIDSGLLSRYPYQVSGGEIQRAVLSRVMAFRPDYLFLDEPTSMLDASVQAHILSLIRNAHEASGMGIVLITHDLDIVRAVCKKTAVMDGGRIVDFGSTSRVLSGVGSEYVKRYVGVWDSLKNPKGRWGWE